ncbi:MAG: hypothetical protein IPK12_08085 [Gemmatimonadetes bacterium]|nr:hypothetical protein [Gemmatimonadota bacterium]
MALPTSAPPPDAMAAVTVTPACGTTFPNRSSSRTANCVPNAAPDVAVPLGAVARTSAAGAPAVAVAEKMTAGRSATDAASCTEPAVVGIVQLPTAASPLALVVAADPVTEPLPLATWKLTSTPAIGSPFWSSTRTVGTAATAVPTVADWLSPVTLASTAGTGSDGPELSPPPQATARLNATTAPRRAERRMGRAQGAGNWIDVNGTGPPTGTGLKYGVFPPDTHGEPQHTHNPAHVTQR